MNTSTTLTATEIGARLARKPPASEAKIYELIGAIDQRSAELRARQAVITPSTAPTIVPDPPDVVAATLKGLDAVRDLERERQDVRAELTLLSRLQTLAFAAAAEAHITELRDAIPRAVKNVPALADHVRETLSAYEAAIGSLQAALNVIAEFENAGLPYPFDDDELAELLVLRNRVWSPPAFEVPAHVPPFLEGDQRIPSVPPIIVASERDKIVRAFPKSYKLLYEVAGGAVRTRRPGPH
jgi:hypothetical protein